MCLGIPGKVVEIDDGGELRMARVGFAISRLDEEEAQKTLELLRMIDAEGMAAELGEPPSVP
jgi:hydrogenase maturation factor